MKYRKIRTTILAAAGIAAMPGLSLAAPRLSGHAVSLVQDPVVMRLSKDEFRIAFGVDSAPCAMSEHGCRGTIRYRVQWQTEDGTQRSEIKQVSYAVAPQSRRGLAVDRQYFDTAEGAHRTEVVKVSVAGISCQDGSGAAAMRTASLASN